MLYVILGAIVLTAASIIHYNLMVKRHQKRLYGGGQMVRTEDVLSLDEEEVQARDYERPPSKSLMTGAVGITFLLVCYYIFLYEPAVNEGITFDELGVSGMCEQVRSLDATAYPRGTQVLLIVAPDTKIEYANLDPEKKQTHKMIDDVVKQILGQGRRFEIAGIEPSASIVRKYRTREEMALTPEHLRDVMREYPQVKVVISLMPYRVDDIAHLPTAQDRSFYFAVYVDEARLTETLDLAKARAFELAVLSRGAYSKGEAIPEKPSKDELFIDHFLQITPANERHIRDRYRQYIGVYPPWENPAFQQR